LSDHNEHATNNSPQFVNHDFYSSGPSHSAEQVSIEGHDCLSHARIARGFQRDRGSEAKHSFQASLASEATDFSNHIQSIY
jgi:hypothetical protein